MTYHGADRLRPGHRPRPTPIPGTGRSTLPTLAPRSWLTMKRKFHLLLWNAVGGALLLSYLNDYGVHWGALMIALSCLDGACLLTGVVGSVVLIDEADPEED